MLLYQLYTACEPAAWGATQSLGWECPVLGIRDPAERAHPDRTHAESAAVIVSLHENARDWESSSGPRRDKEKWRRGKPRLERLDPPRAATLASFVPFQPWDRWGDLFNCIVPLPGRSQSAKRVAESIVNTFSQSQSRRHRVLMVVHVLGVAEARFVTCCAATSNAAFHCHGQDACACLKRPPGAACASSHREK